MATSSMLPLFHLPPKTRRRALISLTPLIDMVFILLVFFMLASSFQHWRAITVSAAVPESAGSEQKGALLIQVRPDGLRLGGHSLSLSAIGEQVRQRQLEQPGQTVLVEPMAGVPLQLVVQVLDHLSAIGVVNLSLSAGAAR
jgi:biopolymer transport protein ExbD